MYLSRLLLNLRSRIARRDLANPYELHRTLSRVFALDGQTPPARFLWRLETVSAWQDPVLLVQSRAPGNWVPLAKLPNYLQGEVQEKRFDPAQWLEIDRAYRFRLQANPTVTRNGKRRGLHKREDQLAWLARQGERHGFIPTQVLISGSAMLQGRKREERLSVLTATFDGYLQVKDVNALMLALCDGIGPAKSLGCGLLSLGKV